MKKNIVFSKYSNERAARFAIRTDILSGEDGKKTVVKTACRPEGRGHIRQIVRWQEALSGQFRDTGLLINRAQLCEDGSVQLEYLEGETLEQRLYRILMEKGKEAAIRRLEEFLELLQGGAPVPFVRTEEFTETFGTAALPDMLFCMPVTDIDMVPENILLTEEGGREIQTLIDYEWSFAFPIPVHFVIYRAWRYFLERCCPGEKERLPVYCGRYGMTQAELSAYADMEKTFQDYVTAGHMPLRELYADITPGCTPLSAFGLDGMQERESAGGFVSTLAPEDTGASEKEDWRAHGLLLPAEDGSFEVFFDLQSAGNALKRQETLRFDPLEGQLCRIRIREIISETPVTAQALNAFREDETDVFWTRDPAYRLSGQLDRAKTITVRGILRILTMEELLPEMVQIRADLEALKNTKGFRALEKGRSIRNYVKARAKAKAQWAGQTFLKKNKYQDWYLTHRASEQELERQREKQPEISPRISILVPAYRTPVRFLEEMLNSVLAQTYRNWELCIADGGSGKDVLDMLERYSQADSRIRILALPENGGIAANSNAAAGLADGEFVTFLDHDDLLEPDALYETALALQDPQADMAYTDEDKVSMDGTEHFDPNLKPDFSPDLLRSHNYITHLCVIRKTIFDGVGGFRSAFDGAQDYDLFLRCSEKAEKICHVPKILYHWRMHKNSTAQNPRSKPYAYEAGKKALEEHLERTGLKGEVEAMKLWGMNHVRYSTGDDPLVSVIIPNRDHADDLEKCVRSILEKSSYRNLEILVVENNSRNPETFACYERLQKEFPQVRAEVWEREFNYSAINNFGVSKARGDYLLLLNNDTELIAPDAIAEMLGCCMRKEVGCVGAKLLYADNTVQHVGIVLGFGGFAGHIFTGIPESNPGYMGRAQATGNFSAVTAACMMVRREVYQEIGGFSEKFAVALNDVDFCMRLRERGYLIVMNPFALWHHYESKTRGYEDSPQKKERFRQEIQRFRERWGKTVDAGDPYYNPNFSVDAPFTLI